jgi:hypothetical protein
MSASSGVASDCKAMLRATDDLRCVLEAHAAHLHEVNKKKLKNIYTKKNKRVAALLATVRACYARLMMTCFASFKLYICMCIYIS